MTLQNHITSNSDKPALESCKARELLGKGEPIMVGQLIYTGLYSRGFGVVSAAQNDRWGQTYDIVFQTGQRSLRLPESILRGVQWTVYSQVVGAEVVQLLLFRAEELAEEQQADEVRRAADHATAVAALRVSEEFSHLTQEVDGRAGSKLAVVNIRKTLKKAFPGVKFSVRSDYSSARVRWVDGPTDAQVCAVVTKFQAGSFNGMEDIYEYRRTAWGDVFGAIQYVFTDRESSQDLIAYAIAESFRRFPHSLAGVAVPTFADYESGSLHRTPVVVALPRVDDLQALIRRLCWMTRHERGVFVTELD